MHKLI